ncbi:unnamed protein product [Closterium sp. Naga37s-1]|nr:unnamed protein product [Closterium sp. Naga37s-1]
MWSPEADLVASPPEPDEWVDSPGAGSEVSRSHWMPEEAFKRCTNPACGKEFTQRRRKHHCRCCGNVYCSKCTGYVLPLNPLSAMIEAGGVKAKVCELCYEICAVHPFILLPHACPRVRAQRAVDEGYAESTGSEGDGEAHGSVVSAQGYDEAESPAAAPADSLTHASAAKSGPSDLAAEQASSPNSILSSSPSSSAATPAAATANSSDGSSSTSAPPPSSFDSAIPRPSSAGPSTLSDRLSHARPPSSLEEDIFGSRPRLRAAVLQDHRPHSSGGRVASSAFPRFNSISGAASTHGSGTGGAGGNGSISIGGVGMGGTLWGSGGSGELFLRSVTLSASHERATRAAGSGLSVEGGAENSAISASSTTSSYSAFAGAARSSSSSAVTTSTGDSSRGAGDRVRVLQRYRHLSVSLDEERGARKGRGAAAGAWAAADRAAAAGPQHLDLAGSGGSGGSVGGTGGGMGSRVPLGLPPRADARQKQQQQQQQQGEGSRGGSGGSMRGGTAGPGNKIGLSLDLLAKMNFPSQPSPSHPSPSYPSSAQPSPSLSSEPSWKRPSPLHSPASAIMSPQPFSPSPWAQPGRARGARESADVLVIADRGAELEAEGEGDWDSEGLGMLGGGRQAMGERGAGEQLRGGQVGGVSVEEQEREAREREEREREAQERVEGEQRRREELYEELGAGLLLESPSAHVKGAVKSVQLHDLLAAWEKGESVLDSTTSTVSPLPAVSPLPTTASPLTLLASISHRMGLAAPPAPPAPALEQLGEARGEKGHKEAGEAAAGGALDEVKRSLAASMGAAGGGGEARTAASGGASGAPQESNPPDAKAPGTVAPGASGGAAAESSALAVRAAPASLLQWSSSDVLHWLRSSVPFRSAPAAHYAAGFEKAGVEGITLVGMTRGHPALANMRPADLVAFEVSTAHMPRMHVCASHILCSRFTLPTAVTCLNITRPVLPLVPPHVPYSVPPPVPHPAPPLCLSPALPFRIPSTCTFPTPPMASQVERRRVVAAHAAGQPASELGPRPATAVGVTGMDSQQLRPGQAGQAGQQQHAKLVPPRQFRALHLDGFSSASSRATTPADTPHSTDSRILNPVPARPATAAAGSGGAGGQKKGAVSSAGGSGWLFGWSSGAAKDSPASAEVGRGAHTGRQWVIELELN